MKLGTAILIFLVTLIPSGAHAQDADSKMQEATGCLRESPVTKVYLLTDQDGKMWDLRSDTVALAPHVGHTVKVTGNIPKPSEDSADTSPQNHLIVTKLDMVRNNCKEQ